jgi:hypothetical protein
MSATTVRVKEAVPELEDQNNAEYETLVNRVKDVERQYKLGEVDEKEIATDGSGGIRWKFVRGGREAVWAACDRGDWARSVGFVG